MVPILVAIAIVGAAYIMNFPGGPTGFATCTKMWLYEKSLAH